MTSSSAGSRGPTHYQVLDLQPSLLSNAEPSEAASLIKRAYRRALLRNHPDKAPSSSPTAPTAVVYSVDQISTAYAVLSAPAQRADYDAALRKAKLAGTSADDEESKFQTGIENVDLDDLGYDEGEERWYRACRCGNDRGYAFAEDDLVEASEDGVLLVGCQDCSLWLKVHFAEVEE